MLLFSVDSKVVKNHLESPELAGEEAAALLVHRSISDGTPIYLDDETMMPVEPLCSWGRNMSYADLARSTLKDYGRIMARFAGHQEGRGRDVLTATGSDLVAFKKIRTQLQERPIGSSAWGKESGLLNQFFGFAVDEGHLPQRPVRVAARGRNPLAPRVRRGMDIRHLTLDQYCYFRDVGLGGQRPDSRIDRTFRGWAPHRNRAGSRHVPGIGGTLAGVGDGAAARARHRCQSTWSGCRVHGSSLREIRQGPHSLRLAMTTSSGVVCRGVREPWGSGLSDQHR